MKNAIVLATALISAVIAAGVTAIGLNLRARAPIPPCYELSHGPRLCITAEPISEKAFFEPAKGPVIWCTTNTAGTAVCK